VTADVLVAAQAPSTPDPVPGPDLDALGDAAGGRLRAVAAAVRRIDGLAPGGPDADASVPTERDVRELVLRTLRVCGDLDNDRILRAVADGTGSAAGLAVAVGRPRVALWEAVGDLIQVGLLERDPTRDGVALTRAGAAALAMVEYLVHVGEGSL
jgi:hypothetical protein